MSRWFQGVALAVGMGIGMGLAGCASSRSAVSFDFSSDHNPTTLAGRGMPSLDDRTRPAAWVLMDDKIGAYKEHDGQPLLQWVIDDPVSASPTFRVEAFEPLLGTPTDFSSVLQTSSSADGSSVVYAIRSLDGAFRTGTRYALLSPGADFVILDKIKNEELSTIPPLPPGTYGLAAKIANRQTGAQALAVTYFTVGAGTDTDHKGRASKDHASVVGSRNR